MPSPVTSDLSVLGSHHSHAFLKKASSDHSLYGTDVVIEDQRQLIKGLGEHIVYGQLDSLSIVEFYPTPMYSKLVMFQVPSLTHTLSQSRSQHL